MSETIAQDVFGVPWIINAFPKSGTHLATLMINPIARYQEGTEAGLFKLPWAGTFDDNSWSEKRIPLEITCFKLNRVNNARMVKTHLGHSQELDRWMWLAGLIHVFIYRDLRDVAVSQAWHIINSSDERLAHPEPEAYPRDNFDEVLALVIKGHKHFSGVIKRWQHYAPWIDVDWTLSVRYENLRNEPLEWAEKIFKYAMFRSAKLFKKKITFEPEGLKAVTHVMAQMSKRTDASPTFRKGQIGEWKKVFTDRHIALWKENDPDKWLVKLGYEQEQWYE
jgi:hypothetical protein